MSTEATRTLDLSTRFRRSEGRGGRTFAATAKLSQTELAELEHAAKGRQQAVSEWAREVLLNEARRSAADPLFTEIIAMRMLINIVLKHISCGELLTAERYTALLSEVRTTKHKQASDVLQQYTPAQQKER